MPINRTEIVNKPKVFGGETKNSGQVDPPWNGKLIDRISGLVSVRVPAPCPEAPFDVVEVQVGRRRSFINYVTGEEGFTGEQGQTLVYKESNINRLPSLMRRSVFDNSVRFSWSEPQHDESN